MKKRFLAAILALCMMVGMLPPGTAWAADAPTSGTCGENATWSLSDGTLTISGSGPMENFNRTSSPWRRQRGSIASVVIGSNITCIGDWAFSGCDRLADITIPDSVTSIGDYAFSSCHSLTSVTIPNGVTSIGEMTFNLCDNLTSVTIPNSVTSIGDLAFFSCDKLTDITIPDSVTSMGRGAFSSCIGLTSITIPGSVTSVYVGTFVRCYSLTNVTILDGLTSIGESVFDACFSLTRITIPDSVTSVGQSAFRHCNNLTDVYYSGTEEQWKAIEKGTDNALLTNATIHYNSTGPDTPDTPDIPDTPDDPNDVNIYFWNRNQDTVLLGEKITISAITDQTDLPRDFITWTSSDTFIATIESNGTFSGNPIYNGKSASSAVIHGLHYGVTTITATTSSGKSIDYKVTVTAPPDCLTISMFEGEDKYVKLNAGGVLAANIDDTYAILGDSFVWTTSDSTVISLDEPGADKVEHPFNEVSASDTVITDFVTIYAHATGQATVTCEMPSAGVKKSYTVVVYQDESRTLQKLADDYEAAYNTYIQAVEHSLESQKNAVLSTAADQQAQALMDQDNKGNSRLITFKPGNAEDETIRSYVYKAAAMYLEEVAGSSFNFSDIDVKGLDVTEIATRITRAVLSGLDMRPYRYRMDGNITVIFEGFNASTASVRKITYKRGSDKAVHVADFVSTEKQVMESITAFLNELQEMEKNLIVEAWNQVKNDLASVGFQGLREVTKAKVEKILEKHLIAFEKTGVGKVVSTVSTCVDYYNSINKITSLAGTSPGSLESTLLSMKGLSFDPTPIKDKAVDLAMKELDAAGKALTRALGDYLYSGSVDNQVFSDWADSAKSIVRTSLKCPVNVSIYSAAGTQIGYVGEDDIWFDENVIRIEKYSDAKTIYSCDTSLRYVLEATDYGTLNCTFEEFTDGEAVVRINYYDIPLYEGKKVTAEVPGGALSENRIVVTAEDSGRLSADESVPAGRYDTMTAMISCKTEPVAGGTVYGGGTFVRGDSVRLRAYAEDGYLFMGWRDKDGDLLSIDTVYELTAKENLELTAQFAREETALVLYAITFDANGGSLTPKLLITEVGGSLASLPIPTRDGCTFNGWYTDGGEKVDGSKVYTENTTLYAHWTGSSSQPGDLNGDGKVTMADVLRLARGAAGHVTLTEQEQRAGDINGDGKITMADVIRAARYAAGYSTTL